MALSKVLTAENSSVAVRVVYMCAFGARLFVCGGREGAKSSWSLVCAYVNVHLPERVRSVQNKRFETFPVRSIRCCRFGRLSSFTFICDSLISLWKIDTVSRR